MFKYIDENGNEITVENGNVLEIDGEAYNREEGGSAIDTDTFISSYNDFVARVEPFIEKVEDIEKNVSALQKAYTEIVLNPNLKGKETEETDETIDIDKLKEVFK